MLRELSQLVRHSSIGLPSKQRCILCGALATPSLDFCGACISDLPTVTTACPCCGIPLRTAHLCGACIQHPPPYQYCIAPFRYAYPLDGLLKALKFNRRLELGAQLGKLLAAELQRRGCERPECLIPVPLHRLRLLERGYNQSLELARAVAEQFAVPLRPTLCKRIRHTAPQAMLRVRERHLNVKGAFQVSFHIPHRHVAIFDDIITTGHTAAELSVQLHKAGVERVDVWAFSRSTR